MNTQGITISSVNIENRQSIGVRPGDTVRVHQKIQDKGKTRIQIFEGLVLARKHGNEPGATFTVRRTVGGVGVEKIFPLYSPMIDKIEITRRSKVRRAKLYYIREKVAREIKRQMRRMHLTDLATESEAEAATKAEKEAEEKVAEEARQAEDVVASEASEAAEPIVESESQALDESKKDEVPEEKADKEDDENKTGPEKNQEDLKPAEDEDKKE